MARAYAGILGPVALLTSLAHGWIHGREVEVILLVAWSSLLVFSAAGGLIGWIAQRTVDEAVRVRIANEPPLPERSRGSKPDA